VTRAISIGYELVNWADRTPRRLQWGNGFARREALCSGDPNRRTSVPYRRGASNVALLAQLDGKGAFGHLLKESMAVPQLEIAELAAEQTEHTHEKLCDHSNDALLPVGHCVNVAKASSWPVSPVASAEFMMQPAQAMQTPLEIARQPVAAPSINVPALPAAIRWPTTRQPRRAQFRQPAPPPRVTTIPLANSPIQLGTMPTDPTNCGLTGLAVVRRNGPLLSC